MTDVSGRPLYAMSFQDILAQSKQGDQNSKLFLTYLYLDKWLEVRYEGLYQTHFDHMELNIGDMREIRQALQAMPPPNELEFIKGWDAFFSFVEASYEERKRAYLGKSLFHFFRAKEGEYRKFKFFWAAIIIIDANQLINPRIHSVREAENTILELAQSGYTPAQYVQGLRSFREGDMPSARRWFQKSYTKRFQKDSCSVLIGWLCINLDDFPQAVSYLNEAVYKYHYERLKPQLKLAYVKQDQMSLAFNVAKEIAEGSW